MLNATVSHHAVLDRVSAVLDPQKNYEWVLDEEGDGACVTDDRMIKVGAGWMERMGHEHLIAASCAHEMGHVLLEHHGKKHESTAAKSFWVMSGVMAVAVGVLCVDGLRKQPSFKLPLSYRMKVIGIWLIAAAVFFGIGICFRSQHMERMRKEECDADAEGMRLLKKAGLQPEVMSEMLRTVYLTDKANYDRIDTSSWSYSLSATHPTPQQRYEYCMNILSSV